MYLLLLLFMLIPLVIAAASCPEVIVRQAIVAGQDKVDAELLAFSAVIHDSTGTCTATILNSRYILTAAHCAYAVGANVYARRPERMGTPDAKVVNFLPHPKYSRNSIIHDVAIVEVDPPLEDVTFVTLHNGAPPSPDMYARAAGYGVNKPNSNDDGMGKFRRVDLPIVDLKSCGNALKEANYRPPPQFSAKNYVCAGYLGKNSCGGDTCSGDSGGPLCVKRDDDKLYVQIGVTSAGATCGGQLVPGIYTSVAGHAHWIASTVEGDVLFTNAFVTESKMDIPSTPRITPTVKDAPVPVTAAAPSSPLPNLINDASNATTNSAVSPLPTVTPSVFVISSPLPSPTFSFFPSNPISDLPINSIPVDTVLPNVVPSVSASISTPTGVVSTDTQRPPIVPVVSSPVVVAPPTASSYPSVPANSQPAVIAERGKGPGTNENNNNNNNNNNINNDNNKDAPPTPGRNQTEQANGDANNLRDVQNSRDAARDAAKNDTAGATGDNNSTTTTENGNGNVNSTGLIPPSGENNEGDSRASAESNNTAAVSNGTVSGVGTGSISAIVVAAVLGSLALVVGLFFGVRSVVRGRQPALEFEETGFDDSLRVVANAPAGGDAESAAAEADIPSSVDTVDTSTRSPPPQPPTPDEHIV